MRIALVTPSLGACGGGVATAVNSLARALRQTAHQNDVKAFTLVPSSPADDLARYGISQEVFNTVGPSRLGFAPTLEQGLRHWRPDVVHLHGIWMATSYSVCRYIRHCPSVPVIVSPHGMMEPWIVSRGKLQKGVAKLLYERRLWQSARKFHALTEAEAKDVRVQCATAEVVVIPNGIETAPEGIDNKRGAHPSQKRLLYLGRIHAKKGIFELVDHWTRLSKAHAVGTWNLRIAGWGSDADLARLHTLVAGAGSSVQFLGPIHGKEKAKEIIAASALILPSFSEGLPMVPLEAWSFGRAVAMTDACNIPQAFQDGAAFRLPSPVSEDFGQQLITFLSFDRTLFSAMGEAGSKLVQSSFNWQVIAQAFLRAYI